jgi:hypothetical protein
MPNLPDFHKYSGSADKEEGFENREIQDRLAKTSLKDYKTVGKRRGETLEGHGVVSCGFPDGVFGICLANLRPDHS